MKQIANYILFFTLGILAGFYVRGRYFIRKTAQIMEVLAPFSMRRPWSTRKQVAIRYFMGRTGKALIVCPKCRGFFLWRWFCKSCKKKGYVVIPKEEVTEYDLPSWKGFLEQIEGDRFKRLLKEDDLNYIEYSKDLGDQDKNFRRKNNT